jgi:hypothetical protein
LYFDGSTLNSLPIFSEEATNFKARSIALASALKIELADGNRDIAPIVIPENPPLLNSKPTFNFELAQYKKSETNPLLIRITFC